ncbi:DNRLRE domain-containing protein [Flavobacterium sp.]|uniref:DNRLRE domain-containing protein n=1 Tax=Flavobacterium sp. TaxID=239 RepID=UPI00262E6883|nr:DNRLRE domain-containing protein [Flavobacterium sp.]
MFKLFSLFTALVLIISAGNSQNTLTLQPNATLGKDAFISSNVPTTGQGTSPELDAGAWTIFGSPMAIRGLIDFDLSSLPPGAIIQTATLTLYNNPNSVNGFANGQHASASGSNESVLQRITSPWSEDVAWSNQPTTTSQNEVTLPQSTDPFQNYVLNVTSLIQDELANPNNSFGFLLKLKTESPFRLLVFASSDHPNAALHPKLVITYTLPCTTVTIQPNATVGKDAFISSNVLSTGQGNSPELDACAWTIFGTPISIRGLIDFNLSSIPTGATIQSATLTLYNNPNAVNGYANGQHVHVSGSNESVLQRITSPWNEDVAWNTQPTTTTQNEVTLLQDVDPFQDYTLDVKNLIQDELANPNSSYGFLLKLKTELPYRLLAFASSDHPNAALHPKLEICYATNLSTNIPVSTQETVSVIPNPSQGLVTLNLENLSLSTPSTGTFQLFDTTGKKVFEQKQNLNSNATFDFSHFQKGLYFWTLINDQQRFNGKLILSH